MPRNIGSLRLALLVMAGIGLSLIVVEGTSPVRAQEKKAKSVKNPVEGAWRQIGQINPNTGQFVKNPEGVEMTKIITGGRYAWTVTVQGKLAMASGGSYTFKDGVYTEECKYISGENLKHLVNKDFPYPVKFKDGKWHLQATFKSNEGEMRIDEMWERYP